MTLVKEIKNAFEVLTGAPVLHSDGYSIAVMGDGAGYPSEVLDLIAENNAAYLEQSSESKDQDFDPARVVNYGMKREL